MSVVCPQIGAVLSLFPTPSARSSGTGNRCWSQRRIVHGHLAVFPARGGARLVLDAKIVAAVPPRQAPLFHFDVPDLVAAFEHVEAFGVEIVTPVQSGHWFTIRDPDGNVLMICRC